MVVPILKKGDPKGLKNYRPVSCLTAASKVLERIVCDQLTRFVEVHDLLPTNQHGFRSIPSTMTALSDIQNNWTEDTERNETTTVLFWDFYYNFKIAFSIHLKYLSNAHIVHAHYESAIVT